MEAMRLNGLLRTAIRCGSSHEAGSARRACHTKVAKAAHAPQALPSSLAAACVLSGYAPCASMLSKLGHGPFHCCWALKENCYPPLHQQPAQEPRGESRRALSRDPTRAAPCHTTTTCRLLKHVEVKLDEERFSFALSSAVKWFKIVESFSMSGGVSYLRRRDLRGGGRGG